MKGTSARFHALGLGSGPHILHGLGQKMPELLRLGRESPHLRFCILALKRHQVLQVLCLRKVLRQRKRGVSIVLGKLNSSIPEAVEAGSGLPCGRCRPHAHRVGHTLHPLVVKLAKLLDVLFCKLANLRGNLERVVVYAFAPYVRNT